MQSCQVWGYACARNADALVIVTEWVQFLDLQRLKQEMKQPIIVDLCNIYRREDMEALGFGYASCRTFSEPRLDSVFRRQHCCPCNRALADFGD